MTIARITTQPLDRRRLLGAAGAAVAAGIVRPAPERAATHATQTGADDQTGPERLAALLAVLPEDVASDFVVSWADLERQLDAAGLATPDAPDDLDSAFIQATQSLALSSKMFQHANRPEYEETFGFAPVRVTQSLTAGDPGSELTLVRGPFRERDLVRAWERSDYTPVETPDGTVWSWADGPEVDLSSLVSRFGLGALNNAAILPDDTVVFAPTVDLVAATL
ncbi:MAG: hypothetical protein M3121_05025, partial [Chloroflexota bacterium]|nr:hypothetical protein [Chloroflexota bacterium]